MALSITHTNLPHVSSELASFSQQVSQQIISYLQSPSDASEAAQAVLGAFYREVESLASNGEPAEDAAEDVEGPLGVLWTTLLEVAIQIPHEHQHLQRLTGLLAHIKTQPAPATPAISASGASLLQQFQQTWGQSFWTGLPVFGMTVHDTQSRNPAHAEDRVEINGQMISANLGEVAYGQDEWKSLQTFFRMCKTDGVMDLQLGE